MYLILTRRSSDSFVFSSLEQRQVFSKYMNNEQPKSGSTHPLVAGWSTGIYFFLLRKSRRCNQTVCKALAEWVHIALNSVFVLNNMRHDAIKPRFNLGSCDSFECMETPCGSWSESPSAIQVTSCSRAVLTANLFVNDAAACCWLQPLRDSESRLQSQWGAYGDVSADEQVWSSDDGETMNQALFTCWITTN